MERIIEGYNQGYTKALLVMQKNLPGIIEDLRLHRKRITPKLMEEYMSCCLDNREGLRESRRGFIRWDMQKEGFEFFDPDMEG